MGTYHETKHDAFNLKFKEHEVFKDKLVVVDESNSAFIWIDKETETLVLVVSIFIYTRNSVC